MLQFIRKHMYALAVTAVALAMVAGAVALTMEKPPEVWQLAARHVPALEQPEPAVRVSERGPADQSASRPAAAAAGPRQPETPQAKSARMFSEVVSGQADSPAMVLVGAPWCGPCRKMLPIIGELERRYQGKVRFVYVDIDRHPGIASQYQISDVPVQLFFDRNGRLLFRHVGFYPRPSLIQRLDAMRAAVSDQAKLPRNARAASASGG